MTQARQESLEGVQGNQDKIGDIGVCCFVPIGIASLVIAYQYGNGKWDTSSCNDDDHHILHLITFLYIGGGICLGFAGLFCIGLLCNSPKCIRGLYALGCCVIFFLGAWSIIGIVMYANMSTGCQQQPIAKMILSFSILMLIAPAIAISCLLCTICCFGVMGLFGAGRRTETEPLMEV